MPGSGGKEGLLQVDFAMLTQMEAEAARQQAESVLQDQLDQLVQTAFEQPTQELTGIQTEIEAAETSQNRADADNTASPDTVFRAGTENTAGNERVYTYVHPDGKEYSGTEEQAAKICPVLGQMSVQARQRTLAQSDREARMAERGRKNREAAEAAAKQTAAQPAKTAPINTEPAGKKQHKETVATPEPAAVAEPLHAAERDISAERAPAPPVKTVEAEHLSLAVADAQHRDVTERQAELPKTDQPKTDEVPLDLHTETVRISDTERIVRPQTEQVVITKPERQPEPDTTPAQLYPAEDIAETIHRVRAVRWPAEVAAERLQMERHENPDTTFIEAVMQPETAAEAPAAPTTRIADNIAAVEQFEDAIALSEMHESEPVTGETADTDMDAEVPGAGEPAAAVELPGYFAFLDTGESIPESVPAVAEDTSPEEFSTSLQEYTDAVTPPESSDDGMEPPPEEAIDIAEGAETYPIAIESTHEAAPAHAINQSEVIVKETPTETDPPVSLQTIVPAVESLAVPPTIEAAINPAPISPELPAPVKVIEAAITQIHEALDTAPAQENKEATEIGKVHEIIGRIIRLPEITEFDPENVTEVEHELEALFTELFEAAHITHTPELIESFVVLTRGQYLEQLWQALEEQQGDEDSLPDEIGTREFLQKLRQSLSQVQKKLRHLYEIGKSALHLYSQEPANA